MLVVGSGSIGRRHLANLRQLGVPEVLVYDPVVERAVAAAEELGGTVCADLDAAYRLRPAAALICAPTSFHLPLAVEALRNGCDVFVEKPLSHTLEGVDELLRLQRDNGRVVMVGFNLRFNALIRAAKTWLEEDRIGRITSARMHFGSYLPWRHPWEDYRQSYAARQDLGGGVILDAIHEIDYVMWWFGTPAAVFCAGGKLSGLEIETEDVAELLLSYPGGPVVSIHVDYLQRPHQRWCEIIGDGGFIRCDLVARTARLYLGDQREWVAVDDESDPNAEYVKEMTHFLSCVAEGQSPTVDAQTAARSLAVAVAAKTSALDGSAVDTESFLSRVAGSV